eukprot:m.250451 g.250451  ORF g.250451 m.250451 type:complete len:147 (-) comp19098_c0_seq12:447-887(-)
MGLSEAVAQESLWTHGNQDMKVLGGLKQFVEYLCKGLDVLCDWPVHKVDTSSGSVTVQRAEGGARISAKAAIVAVSLPALQRILFEPPLPEAQTQLQSNIACRPVVKVLVRIPEGSAGFWPSSKHSILCANAMFPELWRLPDVATT